MNTERSVNLIYAGDDGLLSRIDLPCTVQELQLEALSEPPTGNEPLLLVTSLVWLEALTPTQRALLSQVASVAADWLVVSHADASDSLLLEWLQQGATDVVSRDSLAGKVRQLCFTHTAAWRGKALWLLAGSMAEDGNAVRCAALRAEGLQVTTFCTVEDLPATDSPALILCTDLAGLMLAKVYLQRTSTPLPVVHLREGKGKGKGGGALMRHQAFCVPYSIPTDELVALICQQISAASLDNLHGRCTDSEQMLQLLDEHAVVSTADRNGLITSVNDLFCTISGYSREELIGQDHRLVRSGVHDSDFYRQMWSVLNQGKTWQGVVCNRNKMGDLYWVEASIAPFFNPRGEIAGYSSIRTDITALKTSEEQVRNNAEMLRQSQTFANVGTWDWNIQTGELYWSERIAPLFGYNQGEVETSYGNFIRAVHPDDRESVEQAVARSVENGLPYEIEHRVVWLDGQVRWLLERGAVTRDSAGRPLHMLGVVQDIHERKTAELALAQSRAQLAEANAMQRLVLDTIPARVFWKDRDLRYLGANQTFCRDAGKDSPEALIGLSDHDMPWGQGESARYNADDIAVMEQNLPRLNYEEQQTTAYGRQAWVRTSKIPMLSASGEVIGLLGVYEDITEARLAQQSLRESEERLSLAVEGAGDGIWDWNIHTGDMTFSPLYMAMLGYDEHDLPHNTDTWVSGVHPDDLERVKGHLDEYLHGLHASYALQLRLRCKSGRYKWVLCRGKLVERDEDGQPLRMIGIHADISEQKQLEENLSMFRQVFDASDQCMAISDSEGILIFVNQAYTESMGYSASEVIGHKFKDFVAKDASTRDMLEEALLRRKISWAGLTTRQRADGSEFVATNSFGLVKDSEGNITYLFVIFTDFTQELIRRKELAKAKELAEQANSAKSEFLSSMSHELRTPMNAVIGFAQLLEYDDQITEDQQDNVDEILKAGHHLLELINEVLDLAKIEAGRIDLSMETVDLDDAIKECYDLAMPLATQRQLRFEISVSMPLQVHADRVRLKQVLLNLISNAIKYNRAAGQVTLTTEAAGEMVRISVADTGQGVAPDRLEELFLPFNRLDAKQTDIEGTGIGLTITRRLVDMMGGRIGVDSQEGEGTTFWFELPMRQARHQQPAVQTVEAVDMAADESRQLTVLCIDDNPVNLKLMERMLRRRSSVELVTALEPEIGIELALAHRPDLILLDINMPRLDGYDVLRVLRGHREMDDVPIIAVTANAMPKDIKRGMAAGFADYLVKPLSLQQTLDSIDKHTAITDTGGRYD